MSKENIVDLVAQKGREFTHYKGGRYYFVCEATLEWNGERVVVYRSKETGEHFVRPKWEFYGEVAVDGNQRIRRFFPMD